MFIDYILVFFAGFVFANVVRSDFEIHLVSRRNAPGVDSEASWNPVREYEEEEEEEQVLETLKKND